MDRIANGGNANCGGGSQGEELLLLAATANNKQQLGIGGNWSTSTPSIQYLTTSMIQQNGNVVATQTSGRGGGGEGDYHHHQHAGGDAGVMTLGRYLIPPPPGTGGGGGVGVGVDARGSHHHKMSTQSLPRRPLLPQSHPTSLASTLLLSNGRITTPSASSSPNMINLLNHHQFPPPPPPAVAVGPPMGMAHDYHCGDDDVNNVNDLQSDCDSLSHSSKLGKFSNKNARPVSSIRLKVQLLVAMTMRAAQSFIHYV